jgi:hypothetical protein
MSLFVVFVTGCTQTGPINGGKNILWPLVASTDVRLKERMGIRIDIYSCFA